MSAWAPASADPQIALLSGHAIQVRSCGIESSGTRKLDRPASALARASTTAKATLPTPAATAARNARRDSRPDVGPLVIFPPQTATCHARCHAGRAYDDSAPRRRPPAPPPRVLRQATSRKHRNRSPGAASGALGGLWLCRQFLAPNSSSAPTSRPRRHNHRVGERRLCRRRHKHQLGHAHLGVTSTYLQGIDIAEIIDTIHNRRPPIIPASASLRL